jgi:HK97 family phage major capsid protein
MNLKEQRQAAFSAAQGIIDRAKAAGRDLTDTEASQVETRIAEVKDLDARITKATENYAMLNNLGALGPDEVAPSGRGHGKVFDPEVERGIVAAVKTRGMFRTEVNRKALTGAPLPAVGALTSPGTYPGTAYPLANLFPTEQADGPVVRFYRFGNSTAEVVAEGGLKPDAGTAVTSVDLTLEKIATTTKFSDEFADDAPFLLAHLQAELIAAVITAENVEVLAALTGASGIVTATGTAAAAIDVFADAIAVQEGVNGASPKAIVVTPATLATIRKAKASTGGSYFLDPVAAGPSMLHGVPLISTPNVATGTAWLILEGAAVIYRRGNVTADIGFDADDFRKNLRTLRVEERMATGVIRPGRLTKVTLT